MNSDSNTVKKIVSLYTDRSFQSELVDAKPKKVKAEGQRKLKQSEKEINNILPKMRKWVENPKAFIKILKQIEKQEKRFQFAFAKPVIEDFINILIFDMKRKKHITEKELEQLRKKYSKNKITIHF